MTMGSLPSDRPLEDENLDRLERKPFVDVLTDVLRRSPRDGYTVAVTAPWGDGKTTVMNFVARRLDLRGEARVLSFDPWWFSNAGELAQRFFTELAGQLRTGPRASDTAADALVELGRALQFAADAGVPLVALAARAVRRSIGNVTERRLSVREQKRATEEVLRTLGVPILVMVDDIDRLAEDEIREVFRLIRAVGDLPNVTYLLGFDRGPVVEALGRGQRERGTRALEKLVQASFALPAPRRDCLDRQLTETLDAALAVAGDETFSLDRWRELEMARVRRLARNMRHVKRLSGGLSSTIARLDGEVELSEVIALELLRLSEPAVFDALGDVSDLLTGTPLQDVLPFTNRDHDKNAAQQRINALLAAAIDPEVVAAVVAMLFPAGAGFLPSEYTASGAGRSRRDRRVAHPDVWSVYIHRGLQSGVPSRATVEHAVASFDDSAKLRRLLDGEPTEVQLLLDRLEDHLPDLEISQPAPVITELLRASQRLRGPEDGGPFARTPSAAAELFAHRILARVAPDQRLAVVQAIEAQDLSLAAGVLRVVDPERVRAHRHLPAEEFARELEKLVDRFLTTELEQLLCEPDLPHLLWRAEAVRPEATSERVREWITDDRFLLRWFERCVDGEFDERVDWDKVTRHLSDAELRGRLAALEAQPSSVQGAQALDHVRRAAASRADPGRPSESDDAQPRRNE